MKPSKKNIPAPKKPIAPVRKPRETNVHKSSGLPSLYTLLENHFSKHKNSYLYVCLITAVVFALICFDAKISLANDDALYIEAGSNYAKNFFGYFYVANAPLYPMTLGILIKIFGVKLIVLKFFSIVFFASGILMLFKAFENRVPYLILIPALLLTVINFPFLMYASLTYSECLFLLVQGLSFFILFKLFDRHIKENNDSVTIKETILGAVIIGGISVLMLLTRNVASGFIGIILVFLLFYRKFLLAGLSLVSFGLIYAAYRFLLATVWKLDNSQFTSQKGIMFQKDAYNPQMGQETTWGFIERFWGNCQIYISSRLYYVLGFREEMSPNNIPLTLASIFLILAAVWYMYKNKHIHLLFTTLFFSGLLAFSFFSLQTSWGQTRFIMVYLPLILMAVLYLIHELTLEISLAQIIFPFVFLMLFFTGIAATLKEAKERFPVFMENINGDPTFGYTPDWQNYIKMTKWCAQNLPNETKQVAVRKAPMSFIFSEGKEFYPIYNTPTENPDSLLIPLRKSNVNYIMTAELRLDPSRYLEGQFIGTMHRYIYYIAQKYPEAFLPVHQEGETERSVLYKIKWDYIDSIKNNKPMTGGI